MNRRLFLKLTGANPVLAYEPRRFDTGTYATTSTRPNQNVAPEQPRLEPPTIDAEYEVVL